MIMDAAKATIVLADGTVLTDLGMNGNNFISDSELTKDVFEDNLSPVVIHYEDEFGEKFEEEHEHMDLVQIVPMSEGTWWFVLRDLSRTELEIARLNANLSYLAMMTDTEM